MFIDLDIAQYCLIALGVVVPGEPRPQRTTHLQAWPQGPVIRQARIHGNAKYDVRGAHEVVVITIIGPHLIVACGVEPDLAIVERDQYPLALLPPIESGHETRLPTPLIADTAI